MRNTILSFFVFGAILSATPISTSSVTLTGAGNPGVIQQIGNESVYIGPYTLSIGGNSVLAMCVDFKDDTNLNTTWDANITTLSSTDLSKTYNPTSATQYKQEAYLLSQISTPGISDQDRIAIQDAAWYVFDPSAVAGVMNSEANMYYANAVNYGGGMVASQFEVVSSMDPVHNRQQEFMISTSANAPEPASMALMGIGLITAGLVARSRRGSRKDKPSVITEVSTGQQVKSRL